MSNSPFTIVGQAQAIQESDNDKSKNINERITGLISSSPIFLFMKGTPDMPMCGFSANVIGILKHLGANFKTFNILEDNEIREGVKRFANWPTYPQLYVAGKLVGGNDIITELYENGELVEVLKAE
jgi:monothiol glutaredoxin